MQDGVARPRPSGRWLARAWPVLCCLAGCSPGTHPAAGFVPPRPDTVTVRRFGPYTFGASGVAELPDGRLIIAEDERLHPLVVVDLFGSGRSVEFSPADVVAAFRSSNVAWLNDLEGITRGAGGTLFATTSHALPRNGIRNRDREQLVRFELSGDSIVHATAVQSLTGALVRFDTGLARASTLLTKTRGPSPGLNIEAIAWDPRASHLLFGLRGPLRDGSAIVVSLNNPMAVFDEHAPPQLAGPYLLPLDRQGIRDMTWVPDIGAFLVVAGSSGMSAFGHVALWRWRGPGDTPVQLRAPVLDHLKPEGITVLSVHGTRVVVFVCDDGVIDKKFYQGRAPTNVGTPSSFVVLPLRILARDNPGLAAAQ